MNVPRVIFRYYKNRPRRLLFLLAVLAVLILMVAYVVWSRHAWSTYESSYLQWKNETHKEIRGAMQLPTDTVVARTAALKKLSTIATRIEDERPAVCEVHVLIIWQSLLVSSLKQARNNCETLIEPVGMFNQQLRKTVLHLRDDKKIATIISAIPQPDEATETEWSKQIQMWDKAINSVDKLAVSNTFLETKKVAIERMKTVKAAWQEVVGANKEQNRDRFVSSQTALAASYDGINELTVVSEKEVAILTAELVRRYSLI